MSHKQVMIKVNAECDEEIVPIVLALNEIDGVITLESCQRGIYGEACVFFTYGKNWWEMGCLMQELSMCLRENGICCEAVLRLEWVGSNDCPRAKLVFDIEHMGRITDIIRSSLVRINDRMTELIHGKLCTGLHS